LAIFNSYWDTRSQIWSLLGLITPAVERSQKSAKYFFFVSSMGTGWTAFKDLMPLSYFPQVWQKTKPAAKGQANL